MEVQVDSVAEEFRHTNLFRDGVEAGSCVLLWPLSLKALSGDKFSRLIELSICDTLGDKYVCCASVSQDSSTSYNFPSSFSTEDLGLPEHVVFISRDKSRTA